jgi:hypothetical protein
MEMEIDPEKETLLPLGDLVVTYKFERRPSNGRFPLNANKKSENLWVQLERWVKEKGDKNGDPLLVLVDLLLEKQRAGLS